MILAILMSSVMVMMVTLVATSVSIGFGTEFTARWLRSYLIAWPVAATTAYVIMPPARRLTDYIVAMLKRNP
jgi:hypothetical protein